MSKCVFVCLCAFLQAKNQFIFLDACHNLKGFVFPSVHEGSHKSGDKMFNDLFSVYKLVFTHSDNQDGVKKDHDYCEVNIFWQEWTDPDIKQSSSIKSDICVYFQLITFHKTSILFLAFDGIFLSMMMSDDYRRAYIKT